MNAHPFKANPSVWHICMLCGRPIKLLEDNQSLFLFLGEADVQRRGFQCVNCGKTTCYTCGKDHSHCVCGSNAWIALPYLECSVSEKPAKEVI